MDKAENRSANYYYYHHHYHHHYYCCCFVVVLDNDTYYWAHLSSDHPFQVYYKVRQFIFITECNGLLLQSATALLLQSAASVITKCDRCYKVRESYYKVR